MTATLGAVGPAVNAVGDTGAEEISLDNDDDLNEELMSEEQKHNVYANCELAIVKMKMREQLEKEMLVQ